MNKPRSEQVQGYKHTSGLNQVYLNSTSASLRNKTTYAKRAFQVYRIHYKYADTLTPYHSSLRKHAYSNI